MNVEINEAGSGLKLEDIEWVWVLTSPQSLERNNIFAVEIGDQQYSNSRRIVPIFQSRDNANGLKERLGASEDYMAHSMLFKDVGHFAVQHDLEIMLLDQAGVIVAHLEARLEQISVH